MNKRAFIISPIGDEGSEVREHADDVYDFIIRPAMEESGIEAFRSDHLREPGKITDQMYRELFGADLCVALLTGKNANVFYELALAQAAGRPVIVLIEKGQSLPFDIQDLRCVQYDLKPRPLSEQVYVKEIAAHIKSLERAAWHVPSPFGQYAGHVGSAPGGRDPRFFARSMDYGGFDDWIRLLDETQKVFRIMGVSPDRWHFFTNAGDAVIRKAEAGCSVRILLLGDENPMLNRYLGRENQEEGGDQGLAQVRASLRYFQDLAAKSERIAVRVIHTGFTGHQLAVTDEKCLVIPCLFSEKSQYCPLWECGADSPLYRVMVGEFEGLWEANGEEA